MLPPISLRLRTVLLALALSVAAWSPPASAAPEDEEYSESWSRGPARWLLLGAEERACRRLRSAADWAGFIDEFWRRRDPTPDDIENPTRDTFRSRVEEADALFSDRERGSLSPRGRAYLLLGPPAYVAQQLQAGPGWRAQTAGSDGPVTVEQLRIEVWRWRPEDLEPALRKELERKKWRLELETRFAVSADGYQLLAGEDLLRLAARSLVLRAGSTLRAQKAPPRR